MLMEREWDASATSAYTARENSMSARSSSKAKVTLSRLRDVFLDWLYATILLMGIAGIFMIGAVAVATSLNALRMTGYLDVVFGLQAIVAIYILIWLPLGALVFYYKQE